MSLLLIKPLRQLSGVQVFSGCRWLNCFIGLIACGISALLTSGLATPVPDAEALSWPCPQHFPEELLHLSAS